MQPGVFALFRCGGFSKVTVVYEHLFVPNFGDELYRWSRQQIRVCKHLAVKAYRVETNLASIGSEGTCTAVD